MSEKLIRGLRGGLCAAEHRCRDRRAAAGCDCAMIADYIEGLKDTLKPFAGAVFNDNGDMTVSPVTEAEPYKAAYFALRR